MTFLKTTADTNGQSLEFEFIAPPGWSVPAHIHPYQQERAQMISGVLSGRVAGEEIGLGAGEVRVVPAGVVTHGATRVTNRRPASRSSFARRLRWRAASRLPGGSLGTGRLPRQVYPRTPCSWWCWQASTRTKSTSLALP